MALSEDEKQILAEMEKQFGASDPMRQSLPSSRPEKPTLKISPKTIATAVIVALIGLVVLLAGVVQGYNWHGILTGVLGFAVTFLGVTWPMNKRFFGKKTSGLPNGKTPVGKTGKTGAETKSNQTRNS